MSSLRRFVSRLLTFWRNDRADRELRREIESHLLLIEDDLVASGMSRSDARAAAKRRFHGVEQTKELQRDERSFRFLTGWSMDLRLGLRMLRRSPGLTAIAVTALTIAIMAGAAYLEFVNDLFRPRLNIPNADRFVGILNVDLDRSDPEPRSSHEFLAWKERLQQVEELGAVATADVNLEAADGRVVPVRGARVTSSAFRLLAAAPIQGRTLGDADERAGAPPVMVIGERLWRDRFESRADIIGQVARLREETFTIVGVMPDSFGFPMWSNVWTPLRFGAAPIPRGEGPAIRIFGRLKQGASLESAQAELEGIHPSVVAAAPGGAKASRTAPSVLPYVESLWTNANTSWQVIALYSFNGLFLGLLGICALNVATLVFARTATREAELSVRTALGASRGRIVGQLVVEALVMTGIAAVTGVMGASLVLRKVRELWEFEQDQPMPFWWDERMGLETLAYVAVLTVIAALLVGGVPAWKSTGARLSSRLREAGSTGGSARFGRLWTGAIVTQVAVTVLFLLMMVEYGREALQMRDRVASISFPGDEYLTAWMAIGDPDAVQSDEEAKVTAAREGKALRELRRRFKEDPALINATYAVRVPGLSPESRTIEIAGRSSASASTGQTGDLRINIDRVGWNYFATMAQPMVEGRDFYDTEIESDRDVAIVDETFVRLILGGQRPLGLQVRFAPVGDRPAGPWMEIVGVVRDLSSKPDKDASDATLYRPNGLTGPYAKRLILHSRGTDARVRLLAAFAAVDPDLKAFEVMTVAQAAEADAKSIGYFLAGFGAVSAVTLMLAVAGIYALVSFTLARRTREIGVRIALGGAPRRILSDLLSRAFLQISLGAVLGSLPGLAMVLSRAGHDDGASWVVAGLTAMVIGTIVVVVSAVACLVPVRRALRIQPTQALRAD